MASQRDVDVEYDEHAVTITPPERQAAGVKAVKVSLQAVLLLAILFATIVLLTRELAHDSERSSRRRPRQRFTADHGVGCGIARHCEHLHAGEMQPDLARLAFWIGVEPEVGSRTD